MGCLMLEVISRKRALLLVALLRKMTSNIRGRPTKKRHPMGLGHPVTAIECRDCFDMWCLYLFYAIRIKEVESPHTKIRL